MNEWESRWAQWEISNLLVKYDTQYIFVYDIVVGREVQSFGLGGTHECQKYHRKIQARRLASLAFIATLSLRTIFFSFYHMLANSYNAWNGPNVLKTYPTWLPLDDSNLKRISNKYFKDTYQYDKRGLFKQ